MLSSSGNLPDPMTIPLFGEDGGPLGVKIKGAPQQLCETFFGRRPMCFVVPWCSAHQAVRQF